MRVHFNHNLQSTYTDIVHTIYVCKKIEINIKCININITPRAGHEDFTKDFLRSNYMSVRCIIFTWSLSKGFGSENTTTGDSNLHFLILERSGVVSKFTAFAWPLHQMYVRTCSLKILVIWRTFFIQFSPLLRTKLLHKFTIKRSYSIMHCVFQNDFQ